jgi:hypothetical protein
MGQWNKSDIGKIISYRNENGYNEKVAICKVSPEVPNQVEILEYPISLKSRIALLGLIKNQEVKGEEYLKKAGDWYSVGNVLKDEMGVLEKIANTPKEIQDII